MLYLGKSTVESHRLYRLRMARSRLFLRNLFALSVVAAVLGLYVRLSGYAEWGDVLFLTAGALLLEHTLLWRLRVRAPLHVEKDDPCFIVRHYFAAERERPGFGAVSGCSGFYKELGLETVQIDLRYGLLLDQRTDFLIPGTIPLD